MPNLAELKAHAKELRAKGFDFPEISRRLATPLPQTTLELWCKDVEQPKSFAQRQSLEHQRQQDHLQQLSLEMSDGEIPPVDISADQVRKKMLLAALYVGGRSYCSENKWLVFGHSTLETIQIFLELLRDCYSTDERKLRVSLHCRVGHDSTEVVSYWSHALDIPRSQFFTPVQDLPEKNSLDGNLTSRGICVVSYLSPPVLRDVEKNIEALKNSPRVELTRRRKSAKMSDELTNF
jgi:hypothetical protein